MPFSQRKFIKFQNGMRRRIESLRPKAEVIVWSSPSIRSMQGAGRQLLFVLNKGWRKSSKSLVQIEEELGEIRELSGAMRLESRLEFVEDRWDDFDSEIRERPRRRRKKISLADMLKAAGGGGGDLSQRDQGGINNAMDAYAAMGMEFGSSLADVTAAFRHKAKQLHPDSNNGDRSAEPELRRMLEAYQFLKEYLSLSNTEPPRSPDATYRPTE